MKRFIRTLLVWPLLAAGTAWAGEYGLLPESRLGLSGDSTLHPYHSKATRLHATLITTDGLESIPAPADVHAFVLEVGVDGLESGKDGLDKKMRETLKSKEHPAIRFTLKSWETAAVDGTEGLPLKAKGALSVAGVEKDVVLDARLRFEPGRLAVSGKHELLMSDFGIKPPTMMMGAIKTQDKVVIDFAVVIGSSQTQQTGGNTHEGHVGH